MWILRVEPAAFLGGSSVMLISSGQDIYVTVVKSQSTPVGYSSITNIWYWVKFGGGPSPYLLLSNTAHSTVFPATNLHILVGYASYMAWPPVFDKELPRQSLGHRPRHWALSESPICPVQMGFVWKWLVPHCTQWFCWSWSLWKMAISLGILTLFPDIPKWDLESVFFFGRNRSPNCLLLNVVCRNCRWQLILITEDGPIEDSIYGSVSAKPTHQEKLLDRSDTINIYQPCGVFDVVWCTQSLIPSDKIDFWECSEPGSCG